MKILGKKMISIVIPLYNEEENIENLYKRLKESSKNWNNDNELIFVDDGSYDNTLILLQKLVIKDKSVKIIKFSRNFGHQAAITAGIKNANGDYIVVMDGDLQDPPEKLNLLLIK
jgi:dolichol-phosphate mannosyltransferase